MQISPEDAERIRQAEDGDVVELTGEPLAGHELDWAIADAIGLQSHVRHIVNANPPIHYVLIAPPECIEILGIEHETYKGDAACILFRPSEDLNAAFAAAGVVNLFDHQTSASYRRCLFRKDGDTWCVGGPGLSADGSTPALAICNAIVELTKESQ